MCACYYRYFTREGFKQCALVTTEIILEMFLNSSFKCSIFSGIIFKPDNNHSSELQILGFVSKFFFIKCVLNVLLYFIVALVSYIAF